MLSGGRFQTSQNNQFQAVFCTYQGARSSLASSTQPTWPYHRRLDWRRGPLYPSQGWSFWQVITFKLSVTSLCALMWKPKDQLPDFMRQNFQMKAFFTAKPMQSGSKLVTSPYRSGRLYGKLIRVKIPTWKYHPPAPMAFAVSFLFPLKFSWAVVVD